MSRLIDADALEREGWSLCRTFQKDKDTMVYEVKKPSDFPPIEERKTGKWIISNTNSKVTTYKCSECGRIVHDDTGYDVSKDYPYCHCGADLRGELK